jgi:uncharacterized membrane protein (UPF0127 family)
VRAPLFFLLCSLLALAACGPSEKQDPGPALTTVSVKLPNGKAIRAEIASTPTEQQRGLMFRTELPAGRGMLFPFSKAGQHAFWMYHTLIPLDIVWIDSGHRIVYISLNTPPCPSETPEACPTYGGEFDAQFVLELAAGTAAENGLQPGDHLEF